ncbi:MAG: hypothetical protein RIQ93_1087 [Verrucomicrobiota bacterium]|jgi:CHAD domain-containing protein
MAFKLHPKRDPGREIARVVQVLLGRTARKLSRLDTPVTERIHCARTACKRARAALKLAASPQKKLFRRENLWLRDTARALARARDADAHLTSIDALLKRTRGPLNRRAVAVAREALATRIQIAGANSPALEHQLTQATARLQKSGERLAAWRPEFDCAAMGRNFGRGYVRARAAGIAARREKTAEAFHQWRKATKTCAHQSRLLRAAATPMLKKLRANLDQLGKQLGDEHDLTILREQVEKLSRLPRRDPLEEKGMRTALGVIDARREALRTSALALGRRTFARRKRRVMSELKKGWRRAQDGSARKAGEGEGG